MVPVVQARLCIILRTVCRTEVYVLNPKIMHTTDPDKPLPRLHCMSHDHTGSFCIRCGGKPEDGPDWVNSPCMGVNRSPILPPPRPPRPFRVHPAAKVMVAHTILSNSHHLWFYRRLFWCDRCGHAAGRVGRSLATECVPRISSGGKSRIKAYLQGMLPKGSTGWPDDLADECSVRW